MITSKMATALFAAGAVSTELVYDPSLATTWLYIHLVNGMYLKTGLADQVVASTDVWFDSLLYAIKKAIEENPPKIATSDYYEPQVLSMPPSETELIMTLLSAAVPGMKGAPKVKCPWCLPERPSQALIPMIIHMNDHHKRSRDDVADWLETLDLDLAFSGMIDESGSDKERGTK